MKILKKPPFGSSKGGWVQVGWALLSLALSYAAGQLLKKKPGKLDDDKPTTLARRGSYVNYITGVRRVGPVFACAPLQDREIRKEKAQGGKGMGSPKAEVFYEVGMHILGVGPLDSLEQIIQGGEVIFQGPITRTSHPSGSTVDLGKEGSFRIFWGEHNQPVNTFLGAAHRIGINSRWPHFAYIEWNKKRLSTSPNWPILDYVVGRRPSSGLLTGSDAWYEPSATLDGPTYNVVAHSAAAPPDVGYLQIAGFVTGFVPGQPVRITGNGMADGDYTLRRATQMLVAASPPPGGGLSPTQPVTRLFFEGGTAGATTAGTVQAYSFATDDGANVAHVIADLLFENFPLGLGLDPAISANEPWSLASLEALGAEAQSRGLRCNVVGVDGERADALLANLMQDHGVLLPMDPETGRLTFVPVREPSGTLPHLDESIQVGADAELEEYRGEAPSDRLIFSFADRDHAFAEMTISLDEDGQPSYLEHQHSRSVGIPTVTHFASAAELAEHRSLEEQSPGAEEKLITSRGARYLMPGQAITADGFDQVLRVLSNEVDPKEARNTLKVSPDFYGVRISNFENSTGGGAVNLEPPALDLQFKWLEVPEQLLAVEQMFVIVARIRAHAAIVSAAQHLSRDNSTYNLVTTQAAYATGGTLDAAFDAATPHRIAQGPEITLRGPDASSLLDLSADLTNWGLGRQLCVIVSTAGTEICFLQKATAMGGDTYRLDGLLRARYDTRRLSHPLGAEVYIFPNDALPEIEDILLEPSQNLYLKSQPATGAGSVPLAAAPPYGQVLRGKGVRPINVEALRCVAPHLGSSSYATGNSVTVKWSWSSASSSNTGAGFQGAGNAIGEPALKGSFRVELLTPANVVVQTDVQTADEITYPNATLAASPISEGNFKVRVTQLYAGYSSTPVEFTVTKI